MPIYANIPVVLVVAGDKIEQLCAVIFALHKHCGFSRFYLIVPSGDVVAAKRVAAPVGCILNIVDETEIVENLNFKAVSDDLARKLSREDANGFAGWYLQQFLKMGFCNYIVGEKYYLIWDADTLLLRSISFFDGGKVLLTQGREYHDEYFKMVSRILPDVPIPKVSHISQHLMVEVAEMRQLIAALSSPAGRWWQNIVSNILGGDPRQFSEYETYAAYVLTRRSDRYRSLRRNWSRWGNAFFGVPLGEARASILAPFYEYVAFEDWDRPVLVRRVRAWISVFFDVLGVLWFGRGARLK